MKKYLITILASFLIVSGAYAFKPATLFLETWEGLKRTAVYDENTAKELFSQGYKLEQGELLGGVAYTTISGSDTMKNFPTTYNANNALFDAGKIDVGTTSVNSIITLNNLTTAGSLATVGTITSGSWNATAIPVNKGGTGTTSPSQYLNIIGNGINGLTVASGTGTAGQFWTSNGSNAYASWQNSTVNQTADYSWTGQHDFNATTTGIKIIEAYTASTTITKMDAVYIATSTGNILQANANYTASTTYYQFSGFALNNAVDGGTVYVQTAGLVSGFTGLTKGREYFVGNTAGTISTTIGNVPIMIGRAVSTTQILIGREKRWGLTESTSSKSATSTAYTAGKMSFDVYSSTGAVECHMIQGSDDYPISTAAANHYIYNEMSVKQDEVRSVYCPQAATTMTIYWRAYN